MTVRKLSSDVDRVKAAAPDRTFPGHVDPLLAAIADARARMLSANEEIRLLLAYGRRFVYPHPYTLGELAAAAGMSVSGIRTAFDAGDVAKVSEATGLDPAPLDREDG